MRKIFLIVILIFIAGCIPQIEDIIPGGVERVVKGRGLGVSFEKDMPKMEIPVGENYNVKLNLVNYDNVALYGAVYLADTIDVGSSLESEKVRDFSIDARIDGESEKASVEFGPYYYENELKGKQTRFNVDVKVPRYESRFNSKFCVGKKCLSESIIFSNYSPLSVVVKKSLSYEGNNFEVNMNIEFEEISGSVSELRDLRMEAGGMSFECGEIKFDGEKGNARCGLDISVSQDFKEYPLEISFVYDYEIFTSLGPVKIIA